MKKILTRAALLFGLVVVVSVAGSAYASHSWGNYHWARTANPFTLKTVDSVTSTWDAYLDTAISDWSASSVLNLTKEAGLIGSSDRKRCKPIAGKIRACNQTYGKNGWLGLAQIWASGSHITQATTKVNDTYFNTATYNTPAWKRLVMCQEIAHDFGLAHQNEGFGAPNLGSCMDYTNDPDGGGAYGPSNEHPNQHDYDQLVTIYTHLDSSTTIGQLVGKAFGLARADEVQNDEEWGEAVGHDASGRANEFVKYTGNGNRVVTHVFWVLE